MDNNIPAFKDYSDFCRGAQDHLVLGGRVNITKNVAIEAILNNYSKIVGGNICHLVLIELDLGVYQGFLSTDARRCKVKKDLDYTQNTCNPVEVK